MKRPTIDPRRDPDEGESPGKLHVDRVYGPPQRESIPPPIAERGRSATTGPTRARTPTGPGDDAAKREITKLQVLLADAQAQLAKQKEALATEVEHRLLITAARAKSADEVLALEAELERAEKRIAELEQAAGTRPRRATNPPPPELEAKLTAADARIAELARVMEEAKVRRIDERAEAEERHAEELERITAEQAAATQAAVEQAVAAIRDQYERAMAQSRELHQAELVNVTRAHGAELTRALAERDAEIIEHQHTVRRAELRQQELEQTIMGLNARTDQLARELATLLADKAALEARLAGLEEAAASYAHERDQLQQWLRQGLAIVGPDLTDDALPDE